MEEVNAFKTSKQDLLPLDVFIFTSYFSKTTAFPEKGVIFMIVFAFAGY